MSTFIGMGANKETNKKVADITKLEKENKKLSDKVKELTENNEILEKEKVELETKVKELTGKSAE